MFIDFCSVEEFSENVWENTSVFVVCDFWLCVDSELSCELDSGVCGDFNFLGNLDVFSGVKSELFSSLKTESLRVLTRFELKRKDSHTN